MIKVGIAGIGFMGWIHWLAYQQIEGVEVVAVCDLDEKRLSGDWTGIQGNFGPPGTQVDLSAIHTSSDLQAFCQEDFDLIDICLPPAMHRQVIELGAAGGKHVFCEKPLALNVADCDAVLEVCKQADRLFFVGHVLPFFPEFQAARKILDSGQHGGLVGGYFKRIISNPTWLPHFFDPEKVGGPLFDLQVHDAHFIRLIAGMPTGVYSRGQTEKENEVVRFCHSIFDFGAPHLSIAATGGVIDQQGRPFNHGFEIQLEKGTLQFEYAALSSEDELMPLKLISSDGKVEPVAMEGGDPVDAFVAELTEVVACVREQRSSALLDGQLARDAIQICEAQANSVKTGSRVALA